MQGEYLKDLSDTNFSALIDELKVPPLTFISLLPSIEALTVIECCHNAYCHNRSRNSR